MSVLNAVTEQSASSYIIAKRISLSQPGSQAAQPGSQYSQYRQAVSTAMQSASQADVEQPRHGAAEAPCGGLCTDRLFFFDDSCCRMFDSQRSSAARIVCFKKDPQLNSYLHNFFRQKDSELMD